MRRFHLDRRRHFLNLNLPAHFMQADLGIGDGKQVRGGQRLTRPTLKSARTNIEDVVAGLKMTCDPAHYDPTRLVARLPMRVANPVRAR